MNRSSLRTIMRLLLLSSLTWVLHAEVYLTDAMLKLANKTKPPKKISCNKFRGLRPEQDSFCKKKTAEMYHIALGYKQALDECETVFKGIEKWQCNPKGKVKEKRRKSENAIDKTLNKADPESAFINSLVASGAVFRVTKACFEGHLRDCKCAPNTAKATSVWFPDSYSKKGHTLYPDQGEKWNSCNGNIGYGMEVGESFYEANHKKSKDELKELIALHNRMVGRKLVGEKMRKKCKCMGLSASCQLKHCWSSLPEFGEVTGETFSRYRAAREITGDLEERLINEDKVLAETLVYSETTDYCSIKGVKTKNLPCRPDIKGPGSCELVCCGKGHRKQTIRQMVSILETCDFNYKKLLIKCDQEERDVDQFVCK